MTGVEPSAEACRHLAARGIDARHGTLDAVPLEAEEYDVAVFNHALEHVNEPRRMLREIAELLTPGGVLFVIVPNVESLACRVLHQRAATFDGRNHLIYFSPRTLTAMLDAEGFDAVETHTRIASLDPVLEWLAYEQPYSGSDTSGDALASAVRRRRPEIERRLEGLHLGYKLHCLARKAD